MISEQTAFDIACTYREIEKAEKLLADVHESIRRNQMPDIRDVFGRAQSGLQLGVPSGQNSHRLYQVDWPLCVPILTAHINRMREKLMALNEVARTEIASPEANMIAVEAGE